MSDGQYRQAIRNGNTEQALILSLREGNEQQTLEHAKELHQWRVKTMEGILWVEPTREITRYLKQVYPESSAVRMLPDTRCCDLLFTEIDSQLPQLPGTLVRCVGCGKISLRLFRAQFLRDHIVHNYKYTAAAAILQAYSGGGRGSARISGWVAYNRGRSRSVFNTIETMRRDDTFTLLRQTRVDGPETGVRREYFDCALWRYLPL